MNMNEQRALEAMNQYQRAARKMQLMAMAEMAVNREEAQRCLAEAMMLDALA